MNDGLLVRGVSVTFAGEDRTVSTAVDGVSFDVAPGEVLGILGASGSGKSTLLRAIAGLEPLAAGSIYWAGTDLAPVPVHRRGFALMFQDGQLFPHRSVGDNIAYPLVIARADAAARAARVTELLGLVGLPGFGKRRITSLSGGEQQRVALARALAASPRLLLLDEPLSSLDRELRERLATDLRGILTATGTTAIFVTHDQGEALAIADRIGVMDAGRLVQLGDPASLWRHPATERVARFLGYTSVLADARALGLTGRVALRPESLAVDSTGTVRATVIRDVPTATGAHLRVLVEGVGELEAISVGERRYSPDERVNLRLDLNAVAELS
jgi:thiamine transport system ATP-binding protein